MHVCDDRNNIPGLACEDMSSRCNVDSTFFEAVQLNALIPKASSSGM
jgi:hypothetical protein